LVTTRNDAAPRMGGAADYLHKPINPALLLTRVERVLNGS
jgi:DNA-binding response OmpR family regulator